MVRPVVPDDGEKPWGGELRAAIYDVSDRADAAISSAGTANSNASTALSNANSALNTSNSNSSAITSLQSTVATKANDNAVVHLTGNETIAGVKTFSSAPVVPDGSFTVSKIVNLQTTLDSKASGGTTVLLTTNQTIAGIKTFSSAPVVPDGSFTAAKIDATTLNEAIDDRVNALIVEGTGITKAYNDTSGTLTLTASAAVYPQRYWDGTAWSARPSVPANVRVEADSSLDVSAPPPPGATRYDRWYPHPDSSYWTA